MKKGLSFQNRLWSFLLLMVYQEVFYIIVDALIISLFIYCDISLLWVSISFLVSCKCLIYFLPFLLFLFLSHSTSMVCVLFWLVVYILLSNWLFIISLAFLCLLSLASAFLGIGCFEPGEKKTCPFETGCEIFFYLWCVKRSFV